ncbi:MAG: proline racemase family protein, partial [Desulfohalobiaceae bacterium]|nr:proline racemase family protein [Desulfohalobiaceae bacterium]
MDFEQIYNGFQGLFPEAFHTLDSHTAGESTRLIVGGVPSIPGKTMAEKRIYCQNQLDQIRCLLTREPRGHADLLAALLTEPTTAESSFGLIFMDARRYPYLCGHATIGAVSALIETGTIPVRAQQVTVNVDTPSGVMPARAEINQEGGVDSVSISTVPSFVYQTDLGLRVPEYGTLTVDTVCVGGYFVMVDANQLQDLDLETSELSAFTDLGMTIIEEANSQLQVAHPEREEVSSIDVVEFYRHRAGSPDRGKSLVVYGEAHVDRSPCGTGTAAKLTLLHHKGQLGVGERFFNQGPAKTTFQARITEETRIGDVPGVVVEITGNAQITGYHQFVL